MRCETCKGGGWERREVTDIGRELLRTRGWIVPNSIVYRDNVSNRDMLQTPCGTCGGTGQAACCGDPAGCPEILP